MSYNAAAIYEVLSLAINHHSEGRFAEAEKLYRVVLQVNPNDPDANYNFAMLAVDSGYIKESIPFFEKAIEMHSISEQYYIGYIDALIQLGEIDKARVVLDEAKWVSSKEALEVLKKRIPEHTSVSNPTDKINLFELMKIPSQMKIKDMNDKEINHWNALLSTSSYHEAEIHAKNMTKKYPESGKAWSMFGLTLMGMMQFQEALHACKMAVRLLPQEADSHYNLGVIFQELHMLPQAIERYYEAIKLQPNNYKAYGNLGSIFNNQSKYPQAIECFRRALEINPTIYQVYNNLGIAYTAQGNHIKAREYYNQALMVEPTRRDIYGNLLFVQNYDPDMSAEEIFEAYKEYDSRFGLPFMQNTKLYTNPKIINRRLKIGYVSPDFKNHAVRNFLEPLLANHDKSVVEVYAYAELKKEDTMTQMYKGFCDHWLSTIGLSDDALAERIQSDGIDILVELAGHTVGNRLGVFTRKPAPISLSWLGYGYTTGLSSIDYYLTDEISVPQGSEYLFSEKPWRIESPSYAYAPASGTGEVNALPYLEKGYITFGTLTRAARINYRMIRVWAELLKRVPNSKLIINSKDFTDSSVQEILVGRFSEHGIEKDRLEIRFYSPPWDVLRKMDIGLDCFPHNSGTTLFETLYMGIPYVTLADRVSVGRIGSAILHGLGRDEWIAKTEEEYVDKLVALAQDTESLASIRSGLREEMINSPLMDASGFARKVEKAYKEMFVKWCQEEQ